MSKRLYVGNLSYATTQDTLSSLFSAYGNVVSATSIIEGGAHDVVLKDKNISPAK